MRKLLTTAAAVFAAAIISIQPAFAAKMSVAADIKRTPTKTEKACFLKNLPDRITEKDLFSDSAIAEFFVEIDFDESLVIPDQDTYYMVMNKLVRKDGMFYTEDLEALTILMAKHRDPFFGNDLLYILIKKDGVYDILYFKQYGEDGRYALVLDKASIENC